MSTFSRPSNLLAVLLALIAAGSLSAFLLERRAAAGLAKENETLRAMTNDIDRLRAENAEVVSLRAENQEVERLRKDVKDLYKLRNEVRELREEKAAWEKTRASNQSQQPASNGQTRSSPTTATTVTPANASSATTKSANVGPPKPWLGFYYVKLPQTTNTVDASNPAPTGALVSFIQAGSPAEKAGLKVSDTVVAFQTQPVETVQDLINLSGNVVIGQTVRLDVIREGAAIQLQLLVAEKPQ